MYSPNVYISLPITIALTVVALALVWLAYKKSGKGPSHDPELAKKVIENTSEEYLSLIMDRDREVPFKSIRSRDT